MAGQIEAKLAELGITLPRPMQPIANYVPYVVTGNLVVVSGQVPAIDGKIAITGKVSWGVSVEQAKEAARLCFINVLGAPEDRPAAATWTVSGGSCGWAASLPRRRNSPSMRW